MDATAKKLWIHRGKLFFVSLFAMFTTFLTACDERERAEIRAELEAAATQAVENQVDAIVDDVRSSVEETSRSWWNVLFGNFFTNRNNNNVDIITIPANGGVYFASAFNTIYIPKTVANEIFLAVNTGNEYYPLVEFGVLIAAEYIANKYKLAPGWGILIGGLIALDTSFDIRRMNSFVDALENVEENGFVVIMIMTDALTGGHPHPDWYVLVLNDNEFETTARGLFKPLDNIDDNEWLELLSRMGVTRNVNR